MKVYFNRVVGMEISGLKCDAEDCDYSDSTIHKKDYEMYVNAPCPKCGANLLTEVDFKVYKVLLRFVKLFGWIRVPSFKPQKVRRLSMNGSGKICLKEVK